MDDEPIKVKARWINVHNMADADWAVDDIVHFKLLDNTSTSATVVAVDLANFFVVARMFAQDGGHLVVLEHHDLDTYSCDNVEFRTTHEPSWHTLVQRPGVRS